MMKNLYVLKLNITVMVLTLGGIYLGSSNANAQVKIGSNPTAVGTNANLEIEATNGKKVRVAKDIGTLFVENVPSALSTGADSVMLQSTTGEVHQMSVTRFAAMMKANGVGLPAGGTTGQVLTQTATGTPTWQSPATSIPTVVDATNKIIDATGLQVGQCMILSNPNGINEFDYKLKITVGNSYRLQDPLAKALRLHSDGVSPLFAPSTHQILNATGMYANFGYFWDSGEYLYKITTSSSPTCVSLVFGPWGIAGQSDVCGWRGYNNAAISFPDPSKSTPLAVNANPVTVGYPWIVDSLPTTTAGTICRTK